MFLGTALNAGAQGSAEGITPLKAPSPDKATIVLNAQYDPWNDGTGYQMLLDATHTAYGKEYMAARQPKSTQPSYMMQQRPTPCRSMPTLPETTLCARQYVP